jgi:hypothetical protein
MTDQAAEELREQVRSRYAGAARAVLEPDTGPAGCCEPSAEFPKPLDTGKVQAADIVTTMGCGDTCPVYPGKQYLDWDLPDPAGLPVEQVRPIRDQISARVRALISELDA